MGGGDKGRAYNTLSGPERIANVAGVYSKSDAVGYRVAIEIKGWTQKVLVAGWYLP